MRRFHLYALTSAWIGLLLVGAATSAMADALSGSGFGAWSLGLLTVVIVVILIEAWAYYGIAGLKRTEALLTSVLANLASVFVYMILLDAPSVNAKFANEYLVLVGLLITELVEVPIVMAMNRGQAQFRNRNSSESRRLLLVIAVFINIISYGVILAYEVWVALTSM